MNKYIKNLEYKINTKFNAEIQGIEFDKEWQYNSVLWLVQELESRKIDFSKKTIQELQYLLDMLYLSVSNFSLDEFENDVYFMLEQTKEIYSPIYASTKAEAYFKDINESLRLAKESRFK